MVPEEQGAGPLVPVAVCEDAAEASITRGCSQRTTEQQQLQQGSSQVVDMISGNFTCFDSSEVGSLLLYTKNIFLLTGNK